ncbi:MAG: hypothetical protein ACI4TV_01705, partial [Paludibacteraceae bacterium]
VIHSLSKIRRKVTAFFSNTQIKRKKYRPIPQNPRPARSAPEQPPFPVRDAMPTILGDSWVIVG